MTLNEWITQNEKQFGSEFELLFARTVLPLVKGLQLSALSTQHPFADADGGQRYCDFVIQESDVVRIAIEIDGYDKTGTGQGMSHEEFIDWQRRQASLTSQGWYVLRFANRDVRDYPKRCAEQVSKLLNHLRSSNAKVDADIAAPPTQPIEKKARQQATWKRIKNFSGMSLLALIGVLLAYGLWSKQEGSKTKPEQMFRPYADLEEQTIPAPTSNAEDKHAAREVVITGRNALRDRIDEDLANYDVIEAAVSPNVLSNGNSRTTASCSNPMNWYQARSYVGTTVAVAGQVDNVTRRDGVRGDPTWIDVGEPYPSKRRLALVVWSSHKAEFGTSLETLTGKTVCVTGEVMLYKDTPQIELKSAKQLQLIR